MHLGAYFVQSGFPIHTPTQMSIIAQEDLEMSRGFLDEQILDELLQDTMAYISCTFILLQYMSMSRMRA